MGTRLVTDEQILAAQSGDTDAMWKVVSAHDPIIRGMVRQVAPRASAEEADDLQQEGRAHLISRIRSYDSSQSAAQLHTYAHAHVRRAIAEEWIRMSSGLSVDPTTILRVRKALAHFDGNREAAFLALKARHEISREAALAAMEAIVPVEWLDAPVSAGDEHSATLADTIADPTADVSGTAERKALAAHLLTVIAPRQSYALAAFHGVGMTPTPDPDVAAHLETPAHRVRQLRADGVKSARAYADRHGIAA